LISCGKQIKRWRRISKSGSKVESDGRIGIEHEASTSENSFFYEVESVYKGHTKAVTSMAELSDGTFVSGSLDATLKRWSHGSNKTHVTTHGDVHTDSVTCVLFIEKHGLVVSGSHDCTIAVWKIEEDRAVVDQEHNDEEQGDDADDDEKAKRNKRKERRERRKQKTAKKKRKRPAKMVFLDMVSASSFHVTALCDLEGGDVLASAGSLGSDATIMLWDLLRLTCIRVFRGGGHAGPIRGLVDIDSSDASSIVSCSVDGSVKIWNVAEGTCVVTDRSAHKRDIYCVTKLRDDVKKGSSRSFATGSANKTLMGWYLTSDLTLNRVFMCENTAATALSLAQLEDGCIAAGLQNGMVEIWRVSPRYQSHLQAPLPHITTPRMVT